MRRRIFRVRKWLVLATAVAALAVPTAAQARLAIEGEGVSAEPAVVTTGGGFDWTDAGIGAAVALGAVALGGVAAAVARQRGKLAIS